MGQGVGADYCPYITTSEFNSVGTTSVIRDWKTGRGVHCLSQGEALWFYILRWDENNLDIREQFPLPFEDTEQIAAEIGVRSPQRKMTTDFLITRIDGKLEAISIKNDKASLSERMLQLLCIEKIFWLRQGADYRLLFKSDVNRIKAANIRLVTEFYDARRVFDVSSALKHKIAIKEYEVDLDNEIINEAYLKKLLEDLR